LDGCAEILSFNRKCEGLKTGFYASIWRSQVGGGLATVVDFTSLLFSVEVLHFWYGLGVAIGAILGAATSFLVGRHWAFKTTDEKARTQAARYFWVAAGSLALNFFGVIFLTEHFRLKYWLSKVLIAVLVGVGYNFTLHRYFVFRR
jgi:putative flippase GtrA